MACKNILVKKYGLYLEFVHVLYLHLKNPFLTISKFISAKKMK